MKDSLKERENDMNNSNTIIGILSDLKKEIHEKAVYPQCRDIPAYITLREFDAIIANISNRLYVEGGKK